MKKVLLSMVAVATIAMTSCGGVDMCECATEMKALGEKMQKAEGDDADALKKEMETLGKTCEDAAKALEEGKSEEEIEKMKEEFMKSCDAFK